MSAWDRVTPYGRLAADAAHENGSADLIRKVSARRRENWAVVILLFSGPKYFNYQVQWSAIICAAAGNSSVFDRYCRHNSYKK